MMRAGAASVARWLEEGGTERVRRHDVTTRLTTALRHLELGGILLVTTASVVLFGAVQEWVLAPIELAVFCLGGLGVVHAMRERSLLAARIHPVALPLFCVVALGIVQLLPLPAALTHTISPGIAAMRADLPGAPATMLPLSIYPYLTRLAVLRVFAYAVFFVLALDVLTSPAHLRIAVRWAAGLGTLVALYALFSYLAGNHYLLWLPHRHYRWSATGTYVNRNNFAALMVLLLPALLVSYWTPAPSRRASLAAGERIARAGFFLLCGVIMGLALVFSRSRGGIAAGVVSISGLALVVRRHGGRHGRILALLPAVLGLIVIAWGIFIGLEGVADRFARVATGADGTGGRGEQWADTLAIVRDFPLVGSGLGTYGSVYPSYKTARAQAIFAHAHNDYLEILAEGGIVAFAFCAWAILRVARTAARLRPSRHGRAALVVWALIAGIAGMLFHCTVDFNLQIPGNVFCTLLLAAAAVRIAENPALLSRERESGRAGELSP